MGDRFRITAVAGRCRGLMLAGLLAALVVVSARPASAALPSGFSEQVIISGLSNPTAVQFASNGQIVVAQKGGQIYTFDAAGGSKTLFADLSTAVHDFWDRGLLGLALPPSYPTDPSVYVLYTYDAPPGGTASCIRPGRPRSSGWPDTAPSRR